MLDADIASFFDTIDHRWMQKFLEHRIADRRLVRLLMKWLNAGVMEDGELHETEVGTPQGGVTSPLLANIYLHYVLDLWVQQWRKQEARGEVRTRLVRFVAAHEAKRLGPDEQQSARAFACPQAVQLFATRARPALAQRPSISIPIMDAGDTECCCTQLVPFFSAHSP